MVAFILKWLGFTTLKAMFAWGTKKYVVSTLVSWAGNQAQEAIDDPDTTLDEEWVSKTKELSTYLANKKLNQYL